jgi:hypothetical protein
MGGGKGGAPDSDHFLLVSWGIVVTLFVADTGVEPAVRDVDQQVNDEHHRGNYQGDGLDIG